VKKTKKRKYKTISQGKKESRELKREKLGELREI